MAYAVFSVVANEQPSTAKWNILGTNDAAFNNGTGIASLTVGATTAVALSYKFLVYRNAALSPSNGSYTVVTYDTKVYDTGTNIDVVTNKGRFTAPITGFYQFKATLCITVGTGSGSDLYIAPALYKNGSVAHYGDVSSTRPGIARASVTETMSLTAGDYVEVYGQGNNAGLTYDVGSAANTRFSGHLISST